jgi:hypothetical protein
MTGTDTGAKTLRGLPPAEPVNFVGFRKRPSGGRLKLCGAGAVDFGRSSQARERSAGENPARPPPECLGRENPREQPVVGVLTPRRSARDSREGKNPETGARWAGSTLRRRKYCRAKRYVGSSRRKRLDTLREGKAPKGKPHERRRCETKPARVRRA